MQKYEEEDYYTIFNDYDYLIAEFNSRLWFKKVFKLKVNAFVIFADLIFISFNETPHLIMKILFSVNFNLDVFSEAFESFTITFMLEFIITTNFIVYEISKIQTIFFEMIDIYSLLWQNIDRTINISEIKWMFIIFKSDAKIDKFQIYSMSQVDREFIDKEFDKLYQQKRMQYIIESISFGWSVFGI